jgi:hypothetical protein
MAKKKNITSNTSSVETNSFTKGMNKDINPSFEPKEMWSHARNAANNSVDGDIGMLGNEPANLHCADVPYTIIGGIHKYGDEWIIFSTDDTSSAIGIFDDSKCEYTKLIDDPCLNFDRQFLITGASKENFDCTWQVYFDDGLNPSRSINLDDIPWKQKLVSAENDPCEVYENIEPLQLDCEKIRLAPLLDTPCVELNSAQDGGMLRNGAYQAYVAYNLNGVRVGDYIGISNIQTLFNHEGNAGSLDVTISNIDNDFDDYELVILSDNQGQKVAKRIGVYDTNVTTISIDFIDPQLVSIPFNLLFLRTPAYEKSDSMYVVNDYLIRSGPTEQFDFNYQPLANQIKSHWVSTEYDRKLYYKETHQYGFLRDEQYAFFIRWIYNTGEKSKSYHIPGRPPFTQGEFDQYGDPIQGAVTDLATSQNNSLSADEMNFQVYNTATIESQASSPGIDGGTIVAEGRMGYWESTERYPSDRPDIWTFLCGKHIRHHKMPTEELDPKLKLYNNGSDKIRVLGVKFTNIMRPRYNDGTYIENIIGYEILRGSREGNKSILAKGIFRNVRKYDIPEYFNPGGAVGLYPNHPYNDLRSDVYFHDGTGGSINLAQLIANPAAAGFQLLFGASQSAIAERVPRTDGCESSFNSSKSEFPPLSGYKKDVFTFHSPDLMFKRPVLNAYEARIYGSVFGDATGKFVQAERHPKAKLLRNITALVGAIIGIGYAIQQARGTVRRKFENANVSPSLAPMPLPWGVGNYTAIGIGGVSAPSPGSIARSAAYGVVAGAQGTIAASSVVLGADTALDTTADLAAYIFGIGGYKAANFASLYGTNTLSSLAAAGYAGEITSQGTSSIESVRDTSSANLPDVIQAVFQAFVLNSVNIAIGGQEIVDLIYNLVSFHQYAYKHVSSSRIESFASVRNADERYRSKIIDANYLGNGFQVFGDVGQFRVNNIQRPDSGLLQLKHNISNPDTLTGISTLVDRSRYTLGGDSDGDYGNTFLLNPEMEQVRRVVMNYGALKFNFENQYGQLENIKQTPMSTCVFKIPAGADTFTKFETTSINDGDTFIGQYTEKVIMPIFTDFMLGQPENTPYNYLDRINVPFPRFWMDTTPFDMSNLARAIASFGVTFTGFDSILPNDQFYLDRGSGTCTTGISNIFNNNGADKLNGVFNMVHAYFYTHCNGILNFFVESEVNLANRDWVDEPAKRIFDHRYDDEVALLSNEIIKADNFYKYDYSLSPSRFITNLTSFGIIQDRDYDPLVSEKCFTYYPKRLIYSLRAIAESKKDNWRQFLVNNYKDFKSIVNVIKPINQTGAIIFFPYESPKLFVGTEELKTGLGSKVTIGDGQLFAREPSNIVNSDVSNEYGSCESQRAVLNTPYGFFFISQAQGKIFQQQGQSINPISDVGLKWWMAKYLPSFLIKQFPELQEHTLGDNPVIGVGCQTVYDITDNIVYFCKKDFKVKDEYLRFMSFNSDKGTFVFDPSSATPEDGILPIADNKIMIGDETFFEPCSWTVSYDPKAKAWISFHDWHPELSFNSINHFLTTKSNDVDTPCPPEYTYNPLTGGCEKTSTEYLSLPAQVIVNSTDPIGGGTIPVDPSCPFNDVNFDQQSQQLSDLTSNFQRWTRTTPFQIRKPNSTGTGAPTKVDIDMQTGFINQTAGTFFEAGTARHIQNPTDPNGNGDWHLDLIDGFIWDGPNGPNNLTTNLSQFGPNGNVGLSGATTTGGDPNDITFLPAPNNPTNAASANGTTGVGARGYWFKNVYNGEETYYVALGSPTTPAIQWLTFDPRQNQYDDPTIVNNPLYNPTAIGNITSTQKLTGNNNWNDNTSLIPLSDLGVSPNPVSGSLNLDVQGDYTIDDNNIVVPAENKLFNGSNSKLISCALNTEHYNGFWSKCGYDDYEMEITLRANDVGLDNDSMGIVIGAFEDINGDYGPVGLTHSLYFTVNNNPESGQVYGRASIYYNAENSAYGLVSGDPANPLGKSTLISRSLSPWSATNPTGDSSLNGVYNGYLYKGATRFKVVKTGMNIQIFATETMGANMADAAVLASSNLAGNPNASLSSMNQASKSPGDLNPYTLLFNLDLDNTNTWTYPSQTIKDANQDALLKFEKNIRIGFLTSSQPRSRFYDFKLTANPAVIETGDCDCPSGYTKVYENPNTGFFTEPTGDCGFPSSSNIGQNSGNSNAAMPRTINFWICDPANPGQCILDPNPPAGQPCQFSTLDQNAEADCIACAQANCLPPEPAVIECRKVECVCPTTPSGYSYDDTTGQCDDVYAVGDPSYINTDPQTCNYSKETKSIIFQPTTGSSIWRHNYRCDLFSNFYFVDYPWEVEFIENSGQTVNTVRSLEYQLESYVYKGDNFNGCGDDRWHDLDFNFDESIIYNTEQVSGLLKLELNPKELPLDILEYPKITPIDIKILYSKEEQKYRFNQFWDVTRDRGEFSTAEEQIFITQLNGYIKDLNANNLNYQKEQTQRKKFRHYYNKFILRRKVSGNRKMLLKVSNAKLNLSFR